jgi:DUF4097 and DUF4098 domain-containing protein YvlB
MTMVRSILKSSIVALAGVVLAAPAAQGQRYRDRGDIDTTFTFDKTGTISVGGGSGTIAVTGWDQSTVRIRAHADDGSVRFEATPRKVTIDPTRSHDDVTIEVMVPRGVRVEARTNSGDITIHGSRGDVDAQTSSGDIDISDVRAVTVGSLSGDVDVTLATNGVNATTNNGDLVISRSGGKIDATTVSGGIEIERSTSSDVRASNTSGDITYTGTIDPKGRYDFTTHSGDLDLEIPKDASAQVSVTTWNGTLDTEFSITIKPGSRDATKHYTFTIGAGSAHITAETFSGDISIRSRGAF